MTRLPRDLTSLAEAEEAMAELLSALEPVMEFVESGRPCDEDLSVEPIWYRLREAKSNAAAKLADFENGTDV